MGELKTVLGATWEEDIGGISELMNEGKGPALLFDEIPGYPRGYRVASNLFTTVRRTAAAVGMEEEGLARHWSDAVRNVKPIPPSKGSSRRPIPAWRWKARSASGPVTTPHL